MIIATAGHIDHGKTVLVKALTGVDTDRLPEEKARGVSIDLGFAYDTLTDGTRVGFIDVPGHERFVRNMLAGVTGIDFALLVVAADDGPMPQTLEHLAILDLLGLSAGAVALTKIDRVDPQRVTQVRDEIELLLADTAMSGAPIFPVSGITGEGIPALQQHLSDVAASVAGRRTDGHFRLAVDRCFTLSGAGVVVTGTVFSGTVSAGDRLLLSPSGLPVRVRSIHAQNQQSDVGTVGQRCALNITGGDIDRDAVHRGDWVLPGAIHAPSDRLDARVRLLPGETKALRHWTPVHIHLGAIDVTGRVAILDGWSIKPGESGRVQLVLDHPVGALRGDRLILRDQSAQRTVGGGWIIDPFSPKRGRRTPDRLAVLDAMELDDAGERLSALLDRATDGVDLQRLATAWNLPSAEAEKLWRGVDMVRTGKPDAPAGFSRTRWDAMKDAALERLRAWHDKSPDQPGPGEEQLRRAMPQRLREDLFSALILELIRDKRILRDGSSLHLPGHRAALAPNDAAMWERIRPLLDVDHLRPPRVRELAEELDYDLKPLEQLLMRVTRMGMLYRVADNRYYLPDTLRQLAEIAEGVAKSAADGTFDARAYRDATGIGRNVTIQVLEFFDKQGFTRRTGDNREIQQSSTEVFG